MLENEVFFQEISFEKFQNLMNNQSKTKRWISLFAVFSLSFGIHFSKASLSIFAVYFLRNKFSNVLGIGLLISMSYLPTLFVPLIVNKLVEKNIVELNLELAFLGLVGWLVSQCLFALSIFGNFYFGVIISEFFLGCCGIIVVTCQRTILSLQCEDSYMYSTFLTIISGTAHFMGKKTTYWVIEYSKDLSFPAIYQAIPGVLSLCCCGILINISDQHTCNLPSLLSPDRYLQYPSNTILVLSLHSYYVACFHSINNFLPHYLSTFYNMSYVSTLVSIPPLATIVLSFILSFMIHSSNIRIGIGRCGAGCAVITCLLFFAPTLCPLFMVLLLSCTETLIPICLFSFLMNFSKCERNGKIFCWLECIDGLTSIVGNLIYSLLMQITGVVEYSLVLNLFFSILILLEMEFLASNFTFPELYTSSIS